MSASTPTQFDTRSSTIKSGNTVLLRLPNGDTKALKIDQDSTVSLGRVGTFHANELIGEPFGRTYDIDNKKLTVLPPRTLADIEDTDATNELINDGEFVQPLTSEEIQALKQSGTHASDIIKLQIEQHANYSLKTEYSKEKYKKRKEAKYSKTFTTIEPTLFNVCEYWFKKDQDRIRDIRIDALSQILNMANIRPGGRYLAVDDASGLIVSGILERMGGSGRLITICNTDSPPAYPVMVTMNFNEETVAPVLSSLNWATADETHTPLVPPVDLPPDQIKSDRQKLRLNKRKAALDLLNSNREELFAGNFDSLIIASEFEPFSILERLVPYVSFSGSIVVQSPYAQILADVQTKLRALPQYLGPSVTEVWLRRYQVLPGRTHPTMNTSGAGGFILHAIKVYALLFFYY
ncbi:Gcd10p family-domain-containing protein [Mycena amicta]|nr:Gcd10p family-domain-containing protein [Mycena amicta]